MKVLVVTDNVYLYESFVEIVKSKKLNYENSFDFRYSWNNRSLSFKSNENIKSINIKSEYNMIINNYNLVISLHCKQLFPSELVNNIRCINVHPGFNPFNRGWYPQVFSIINKLPAGVTIHEMDNQLDHGPIIVQQMVHIDDWDSSSDVYKKILNLEVNLIEENISNILDSNYKTTKPISEGNINLKKDFDKMVEIDLNKNGTYKEMIDFLRAMTFEGYDNAYFNDENGNKIYVQIKLKKEDK